MGKLMNTDMDVINIPGGGLHFSAITADKLGASEYTLVTIICDISGSVDYYAKDLLNCVKTVIEACKKSPRAENLLIRFLTFNHSIMEDHGFKLLSMIDAQNDYLPFRTGGSTNLFGATADGVSATLAYAKILKDQDFDVNGAIYIITDGEDNCHTSSPQKIKKMLDSIKQTEAIESLITILIGVNDSSCKTALEDFRVNANLTQYIEMGNSSAQKFAKLAGFVSKSISSQSQALGTGAASQPLSATF